MALMTQSEYAKYRGCSKQTISKFKRLGYLDGAFRKKAGGAKRLIVSVIADKLLKQNLDPAYTNRSDSKDDLSQDEGFLKARTWSQRYKAAHSKLEFEAKAGRYVLKSEVRDGVFKATRLIQSILEDFPAKIAPGIALQTEEFKVVEALNKEFGELLRDLSGGLGALLTDESERQK